MNEGTKAILASTKRSIHRKKQARRDARKMEVLRITVLLFTMYYFIQSICQHYDGDISGELLIARVIAAMIILILT